jgi:hypothetical protein
VREAKGGILIQLPVCPCGPRRAIDALPDSAFIALDGEPFAVRGDMLLHWTPQGYDTRTKRPRGRIIDVLTPPAILAVLSAGYARRGHPGAGMLIAGLSEAAGNIGRHD